MIQLMSLQMFVQMVDAVGQQRDLDLRRAGVGLVQADRGNDLTFFLEHDTPH